MAEGLASTPAPATSAPAPSGHADASALGATKAEGAPVSAPAKDPFAGTRHKLKVDGREDEVEYEELIKRAQKGTSADKKYQEAAQLQKATTEILQGLATGDKDTWAWLKKQVPKNVFDEIAMEHAWRNFEYDQLPEDEKRKRALDEREARLKAEEEAREEQAKAQQWAQEVEAAGQVINKTIGDFFEKANIKPTKAILLRMSDYMQAYLSKHETLPPIDRLYDHISRGLDLDAMDVIQSKPIETFISSLPKDTQAKLKKYFLSEATSAQPRRYSESQAPETAPRASGSKRRGIEDSFALIEKRLKSGRK